MHVLPGLCAEIIASGLKMPRTCHPAGRQAAADRMTRWDARQAGCCNWNTRTDSWQQTVLLKGLDRPHGVVQGPDGKIYVGEVGRIIRFYRQRTATRNRHQPAMRQRHPLTTFALAGNGDLYVNIGSSSDNCETASPAEQASGRCPESEQDRAGVVWALSHR
jgi:glucose/arabinose dehydrogenase